jgi:predicted Zn-dependent peptidase
MKPRYYERLDETLYEGELDNGLKIFVIPKKGFSMKYAFFAARYGGCDRRFKLGGRWVDTPAGIAHFLEHKMFDMPDYNAFSLMTARGAWPNAFTGYGMTGYLFSCTDAFDESLRTMLDYVSTPYFTEESVQKEQGIIGQEIKMIENNPNRAVVQNLLKALYKTHPARETIAGTVESISRITAQTLYDCHKVFYNPSNMALCCSGDLDPERVASIAREMITAPAGEVPERDYGRDEGPMPDRVRIEASMEVAQPLFACGSKVAFLEDAREWTKLLFTAGLGCELLAGEASELYAEMYSSGLINNTFGIGIMSLPKSAAAMANGRCAEPMKVVERLSEAAERFKIGPDEEALFTKLKKTAIGNFLAGLDSVENLCHTHAEGYFNGCLPFEHLDIINEIKAEDAAHS